MSAILIDTSAYVRFLAGDDRVLNALAKASRIHLSIFVLGELLAGFRLGSREKKNREILDRFLAKPGVGIVNATRDPADYFALIKTALKKSGRPIPLNDVWIAAHALETGSVLVTYDGHFAAVPGLRIWDGIA
jgi:tRNA(fMet)-specific endonuclease VapC